MRRFITLSIPRDNEHVDWFVYDKIERHSVDTATLSDAQELAQLCNAGNNGASFFELLLKKQQAERSLRLLHSNNCL